MERIKQALERARAEREAGASQPDEPAPPRKEGTRAGDRGADATESGGRVAYTKTTTITLDVARLRENRIIASTEPDAVADSYKVLRTHVFQEMRANGWRALGITSAGEGAGKTLTAINLAISLARQIDQTVLLVDLDLKRPRLMGYLANSGEMPGLGDYLSGDRDLPEVLVNPGIDRLVILPGNSSVVHSSEMLSSPRMIRLVEQLKSRYPDRLVLFDMPPALAGDDVLAFSPYVDAIMLVIEAGKTSKEDISRVYELLGDRKILGTVLNKADQSSAASGYY
jgi:capsular exopolysaccharide synthesis family protein